MKNKDFTEERRRKIVERVNTKNRVNVEELSRFFDVTKTTIRRDLIALEKDNLVYRAHGGAVKRESNSIWQMSSINSRLSQHEEEKNRIAQYVARIIHDGESIMIDGGSTTTKIAGELCGKKNLLIVTNALTIGEMLVESGGSKVILSGGELLKETNALVGNAAEHSLAVYRTDTAIIGVSGLIPSEGCFSAIPQEAEVKKIMLQNSRKKIIVTDSSKIGVHALFLFCSMAAVDILVTDRNIKKRDLLALKKSGVEVIAV
ncbi:MAG: DeoR/GlpR family DNA-binding transcription regulator [Treponema sp.]|nr:DeoR/GlpR family DNA-binding transcription regulator [Treponema sp.]